MVVPYGNYQSFLQAHTPLAGNLISIDDTFSTDDHVDAGTSFFSDIQAVWLTEKDDPSDSTWYDLQGRRLSGKPIKSGIYVTKQGRKVLYHNRK